MGNKEKNIQSTKEYNISFENRKKKSNIKIALYILFYIISSILLGYIFSEIRMNEVTELKSNNSDMMIIEDYSDLIDEVEKAIVTISNHKDDLTKEYTTSNKNTTGVIIDNRGYIVTSYSSIEDYENIFIKIPFSELDYVQGTLLEVNDELNLAIISISVDEALDAIKIAEPESVMKNQEIIVIGNIVGRNEVSYVSPGVVTSVDEVLGYGEYFYSVVGVSALVNEKNVGGAICNAKGELIGIASGKEFENLKTGHYGVSVDALEFIINSEKYIGDMLGIAQGGITKGDEEFVGLYIKEMYKNGNGYKAGLQPTDIIIKIDDIEINSIEEIIDILEGEESSNTLMCTVIRNGEKIQIEVKI